MPGNVRHFGWLRLASVGVEIDCVVCYPGNPPACTGQRQPDLGNLIRTSLTQLPGNWARPGDARHFGWCQATGPGQATLGILAGCASACTSFLQGPEGNVPGNVRHFGWRRLASFWCGNRLCRLPALKRFPEPLTHSCTAALPGRAGARHSLGLSKAPIASPQTTLAGASGPLLHRSLAWQSRCMSLFKPFESAVCRSRRRILAGCGSAYTSFL